VSAVRWGMPAPRHWPRTRVKYVCRFIGGGTPDKGNIEYWNGEIPWVSPKDMKSSEVVDTEDHIAKAGLDSSAAKMVDPGAVLIVMRSGILRHSIPVAINRVPVTLNQDMRALIPTSTLEPRYLARLIEGHQRQFLNVWSKEGTTVESLESDLVADTEIAVPPLATQCAIADYLDRETARLDALVAAKERLLRLLAEKRRALIARAVTRGIDSRIPLRDSGISWLGEVPAHWKTPPVYARFDVQLGKMLDEKRIRGTHLAHYLRNVDVQWGAVNTQDLPQMDFDEQDRDKYSLRQGDILVCEGGEIGRSALWRGEIEECYYQKALHRLRPLGKADLPEFFILVMRTLVDLGIFTSEASAATIQHLPAEKLRILRYPSPPIAEQRAIVSHITVKTSKFDALRAATARTIALLKERRAALIAAAVTGKLDVQGAERHLHVVAD
jgi:type I restriction enzyme, S subunit